MFITISIQTYNHADSLSKTLDSLQSLRCPHGSDYEILVINNNSNDNTSEVINQYNKLLTPRLRSVLEKQQGLSHARNRALNEAQGEIVCFLDDDVIVDQGWLEAISDAFIKYSAAIVGGRSYLIYPNSRPSWLPIEKEILLSGLDYGDKTLVNTDKELFGLNFCVSRQKALEIGGFDTRFGRQGKNLMCGEEKKIQDLIRKAGGIVVYEPKAVVGHIVRPERLTKRWFFKRIYAGAVSSQRLLIEQGKPDKSMSAHFLYSIRCCGSVCKSMLGGKITQEQMFMKQFFAIRSLGILVEVMRSVVSRHAKFNKS